MDAQLLTFIVALIGALGGIISVVTIGLKYRAESKSQERKDKKDAGQLALDLAESLQTRLLEIEKKSDQQDKQIELQDEEIDNLKEQLRMKDARIIELEKKTVEQEKELISLRKLERQKASTIDNLEKEIAGLYKSNSEKDAVIANLSERMQLIENK